MTGPRKRVYVDNQNITVNSDGSDGGGSIEDDNTLWFRSVDLSRVNFVVGENNESQIADIDVQYDILEVEYDALYGPGTGVVTDYDKTVVFEDLNIDFQDYDCTLTRDGQGRVTEMEFVYSDKTVMYSFEWDENQLTVFDRTVA